MKKTISVLALLSTLVLSGPIHADDLDNNNSLTIYATTSDNQPIQGFRYELIDQNGQVIGDFTSGSQSHKEFPLNDGVYRIVETDRPDGYTKASDITITLPQKVSENTFTNKLNVYTKHIKKLITPKQTPKETPKQSLPKTGEAVSRLTLLGALIGSFALILMYIKKKSKYIKKKSKG